MQEKCGSRSNERLNRLICSDLRPKKDVKKYSDNLRELGKKLGENSFFRKKSKLLEALGNETRLKILRLLSIKEMCVCEITVALDLTQSTASYHLNILQIVELIKDRKDGKWIFYNIAQPKLMQNLFKFLEFSKITFDINKNKKIG